MSLSWVLHCPPLSGTVDINEGLVRDPRTGAGLLSPKSTPLKFNIASKSRQSQKETPLPTIIFQGLCVKFRGCIHVLQSFLESCLGNREGMGLHSLPIALCYQVWTNAKNSCTENSERQLRFLRPPNDSKVEVWEVATWEVASDASKQLFPHKFWMTSFLWQQAWNNVKHFKNRFVRLVTDIYHLESRWRKYYVLVYHSPENTSPLFGSC